MPAMSNLPTLLHDGALAAGAASLLYSGTVTSTALVAVFARTPARQRAARDVLRLLLRRTPA
jgi:hypothetical protein